MTKISSLTEISSGVDVDADFLPLVDTSVNTTKKVKPKKMLNGFGVTKGNILSTDGTDFGVLGVGSNNQVLTADSTQTLGVKWSTPASGGQASDMVYPLNVTIGDYTSPNAAVSSSDGSITKSIWGTNADQSSETFGTYTDQTDANTSWVPSDNSTGYRVDVTNDILEMVTGVDAGKTGNRCYYDVGTANLPDTGFKIRFKCVIDWTAATTTDQNRIWIGLFDATTDHTSAQDGIGICFQNYTSNEKYRVFEANGVTPLSATFTNFTHAPTDETVYIEINRTSTTGLTISLYSDSGYSSLVESQAVTISSGVTGLRYLKAIQQQNIQPDNRIQIDIDDVQCFVTAVAANVYDGNTSTQWISNSSNNPNIYVDLSGSARDIASIAINLDRTATTETQIKLRCSTDTTFTDGETVRLINVSDLTDDTWRFFPINRLAADCRYVQIYGVSNSVVLAINEIKVYYSPTTTDWNRKHFHKYLDPTSATATSLDSN